MKSRSRDGLAAKGLLVWTIHYLNLSLSLFTLTFFSGQLLWGFAFFLFQHWPTFVYCTVTILYNRNWDQFGTAFLEIPRARKTFEFHLARWASNPQILLARDTSPFAEIFKLISNSWPKNGSQTTGVFKCNKPILTVVLITLMFTPLYCNTFTTFNFCEVVPW